MSTVRRRLLPALVAALALVPAAPAGASGYPTLRPIHPGRARPIAYLPVAFPGERALGPAAIRVLAGKVRARILTASQGRLRLSGLRSRSSAGDVLPPVRFGAAIDRCDDGAVWFDAVGRSPVDVTRYAHVVVLYPDYTGCSWGGRAGMPGSNVTSMPDVDVVVHELGHNFGLDHARRRICTDAAGIPVPLAARCGADEYGDVNDIMGATAGSYGGWGRVSVGMLPRARARGVRTTGTYALALPDARHGHIVLRVPRQGAKVLAWSGLCLERVRPADRVRIGGGDGLLVRLCAPVPSDTSGIAWSAPGTWILDTTPGDTGDQLDVGEIFTDVAGKVRVRLDSLTPTTARVSIAVHGEQLPAIADVPAAPVVTVTSRIVPLGGEGDVAAQDIGATVSWTQPAGGAAVLEYHVIRDGQLVAVVPPGTTSWDDLHLLGPGAAVRYRVRAVAASGGSAAAPATTSDGAGFPAMPPAPTGLVTTIRNRNVTLGWAKLPAGSPALRGWEVEQDGFGGGFVDPARRRYLAYRIGAAGTMRLRVRAITADGTPGPWSAPVVARAKPETTGVIHRVQGPKGRVRVA